MSTPHCWKLCFFFFLKTLARVRFLCSLFQSFSARLQPPVLINLRAVRYSGHFYNPITSISKLLLVLLFSFFVLLLYIDDHLFACWLKNAKFSLGCIFVCHIILCCTFTLCCLLIPWRCQGSQGRTAQLQSQGIYVRVFFLQILS
jgi:protein-S-isoprenylcysteine O-methyltransferase Ste14